MKKVIIFSLLLLVLVVVGCQTGQAIQLQRPGSIQQVASITRPEMLRILNSCYVTSFTSINPQNIGTTTCNDICKRSNNNVCIRSSFEEYGYVNGQRTTFYAGDLASCDYLMYPPRFGGTLIYSCTCCSR